MKLRRLFPVLLVWAVAGCSSPTPPVLTSAPAIVISTSLPGSETARISSVYDGDTYTLTDGRKVRILGIDTPELRPAQCFGKNAGDAARALLVGQEVTLTSDPQQGDKDRYGRILRYVTLEDGTDVAAKLLDQGFARVYNEYPVAKMTAYRTIETVAAAAHKGGWAAQPSGCGWTK